MQNAKEEFLQETKNETVVAAEISCYEMHFSGEDSKNFYLKSNYTQIEWEYFLNQLDFEYENGYGTQHLYGTVWLTDNAWLERGEYDGSEWWVYKQVPSLPDYLK